jgi:hypothetical protein
MAELIERKREPACSYIREGLTRPEALAHERGELARLLALGYLLTNWQYNAHRHRDVRRAVDAILSKQKVTISN